jgi:hypothetical protein
MDPCPIHVGSDEKTVRAYFAARFGDIADASQSLRVNYIEFAKQQLSTGGRPRNSVLSPIFQRIIELRSAPTFNQALIRAVEDVDDSDGTVPQYIQDLVARIDAGDAYADDTLDSMRAQYHQYKKQYHPLLPDWLPRNYETCAWAILFKRFDVAAAIFVLMNEQNKQALLHRLS